MLGESVTHDLNTIMKRGSCSARFAKKINIRERIQRRSLSQVAKSEVAGYYKKLTSRSTVEFGHFLWDVVVSLAKLSLGLQTRNSVVSDIADHL